MRGFALLPILTSLLTAQTSDGGMKPPQAPNAVLRGWLDSDLSRVIEALSKPCDPYGFFVGLKATVRPGGGAGVPYGELDTAGLTGLVAERFGIGQTFKHFDLKKPLTPRSPKPGFLAVGGGLTPRGVGLKGYTLDFTVFEHKETVSYHGEAREIVCQVVILVNTDLPKDGVIAGSLQVYDREGAVKNWSDSDWQGEAKLQVRYRRLGPGDDRLNHGAKVKPDQGWTWVEGQGSYHQPEVKQPMTPGHYFPGLRLRGCELLFEQPRRHKDHEVILRTETDLDYSDPISEAPVGEDPTSKQGWEELVVESGAFNGVRPSVKLKTEQKKDHTWITPFSLGNTLKGRILTFEEGTTSTVELKPFPGIWTSDDPFCNQLAVSTDGTYEFKKVPSGVYEVGVKGSEHRYRVEICNCPDKGEKPNHTYEQDLEGKPEILVTVETTLSRRTDTPPKEAGGLGASPAGSEDYEEIRKHVVRLRSFTYVVSVGGSSSAVQVSNGLSVMPLDDDSKVLKHLRVDHRLDLPKGRWVEEREDYSNTATSAGECPVGEPQVEGRTLLPGDSLSLEPLPEGAAGEAKMQCEPLPTVRVSDLVAASRGSRRSFQDGCDQAPAFAFQAAVPQRARSGAGMGELIATGDKLDKGFGNMLRSMGGGPIKAGGERTRVERKVVLRRPTKAERDAFLAFEKERGEDELPEHFKDIKVAY